MNNTLVKGMQLLEALVAHPSGIGVSALAAQMGMGKSNVHRTLQSLVEMGYAVNEDGNGTYRATLRIWELGARMIARVDIRRAASAAMQWLLHESRETVHLSVLDGDQVIYVDKLDSPEPVRAYSEIGGRAPAHCVATGKAMLARRDVPSAAIPQALGTSVRSMVRPHARLLAAYTPSTIVETDDLARELARIRTLGYAVNRGEWRESIWGIGAAVTDSSGRLMGGIGISGPATRIRPQRVKPMALLVVEAARRVSVALAGVGDDTVAARSA